MTDNMKLWDSVEKTDPSATKEATVGGMKITSISGQHMIKKATEAFGPVGIGWGWTVVEERFDKGGPIYRKIPGDAEREELIGHELAHIIKIKLWFILDGQRGEVEQYGCTPFTYKSKWGLSTDGEAPKKSLTDSIKKALSMLGFSADIFMGLFDDREYVEARKEEAAIEKAEDREEEIEKQKQERLDYIKQSIDAMGMAPTLGALKKIHDATVRKLSLRHDEQGIKRIARELTEQAKRFEGAEQ